MATLQASKTLAVSIAELIHSRLAPEDLRGNIAAGSYDAVLEHHRSVNLLVENNYIGSAFALLRPMYDGCIVGLWATYVATPEFLERFEAGTYTSEPVKVIKQLKRHDDGEYVATLKRIHDQSWKVLSTYVHGGHLQVSRRHADSFVGPNYSEEEICDLLKFSNAMAAIAAMELPDLTGDEPFCISMQALLSNHFAAQA
jgi:hypothetical protein